MSGLSGSQFLQLLGELDAELQENGVKAEMYVVGGAALALAFNTRRMTRDVDAVFVPKQEVYAAARRVLARHPELGQIADEWLNDGVKGLIPPGYDERQRSVYEGLY